MIYVNIITVVSRCFVLDHFTVDADFTGIDAVEKDLQFVFKARHDIQTQAQDVLENGLNHLVCDEILFNIQKYLIFSRILLKLVQHYKYFLIWAHSMIVFSPLNNVFWIIFKHK
jgi:hypothetical protein